MGGGSVSTYKLGEIKHGQLGVVFMQAVKCELEPLLSIIQARTF